MKKKILQFSQLFLAFVMGGLVTYITMTKQQMDTLMQARTIAPKSTNNHSNQALPAPNQSVDAHTNLDELIKNNTIDSDIQSTSNLPTQDDTQTYSTNDYTQAQAQAIIENMPDRVLEQYIDKFMATGASDAIADKRRFAQRAIEELYQPNDNQPLQADVRLSYGSQMPNTSIDTTTVAKDAKLYAHLDTYGRVPTGAFVFVKWVNNDTGQVLLFEKKDIVADSNRNWVSFKPDDGWQVGSYDIRFYQFTSELQPIGQLTYHIYEVEDV